MPKAVVYVAASFSARPFVRELYALLRANDFEITHDWTQEDAAPYRGDELTTYLANCAEDDLDGVSAADIVIVCTDKPTTTGGLYVELGAALALDKQIVVLGQETESECIFLKLCERVTNTLELIRLLNALVKPNLGVVG